MSSLERFLRTSLVVSQSFFFLCLFETAFDNVRHFGDTSSIGIVGTELFVSCLELFDGSFRSSLLIEFSFSSLNDILERLHHVGWNTSVGWVEFVIFSLVDTKFVGINKATLAVVHSVYNLETEILVFFVESQSGKTNLAAVFSTLCCEHLRREIKLSSCERYPTILFPSVVVVLTFDGSACFILLLRLALG